VCRRGTEDAFKEHMSAVGTEVLVHLERRDPTRASPRWAIVAARLGYIASGVLYLGIGAAGLAVAVGASTRSRDHEATLRLLAHLPLAEIAFAVLAVGLLAYAVLNTAGAMLDPFGYGTGVRGWALRGADAVAGALYLSLTAAAVRLVIESDARAGPTGAEWAARVLALPFGGVWLVLGGATIASAGAFMLRKAAYWSFVQRLDRRALGRSARRWLELAARVGTAGRGVLFIICGVAAVLAGFRGEPGWIVDLAGGLDALDQGLPGPLLLGLASLSFVAYGAYQVAKARYRVLQFWRRR
jgi:hypothetical protein